MLKQTLSLFFIILCVIHFQCKKSELSPELPPETQTGAGVFACLINGTVWSYVDSLTDPNDVRPRTVWQFKPNANLGKLEVKTFRYDSPNAEDYRGVIDFQADSLLISKTKTINKNFFNFGIRYSNSYPQFNECSDYCSSPSVDTSKNFSSSGKLTITRLDQKARIIAGTFYCNIFQKNCGDTFRITQGRFDFKY